MISLNKVRKAVAFTLAAEAPETPEIVAFIDRGDYAIVGVRLSINGSVIKSLVGSYHRAPDRFFIEKDDLSGRGMLAAIAGTLSKLVGEQQSFP